jgi:hypothetical protein
MQSVEKNMKTNTVLLNPKDNVVTATVDIAKGTRIQYLKDGKVIEHIAKEDIPAWNKAAIAEISLQGPVIKYGEIIGAAMEAIAVGTYVSHLNIASIPRDYEKEME